MSSSTTIADVVKPDIYLIENKLINLIANWQHMVLIPELDARYETAFEAKRTHNIHVAKRCTRDQHPQRRGGEVLRHFFVTCCHVERA
jgi:hypothetical protein